MNKKKAVAQKTFDDKMRSFGRACYWGRASGPARRDARELRAYYKAALAEAERLRVDNEKLKAWRAGAGPMGTGRIGMGPPVLSDGRHPGPGKQREVMCDRTSRRSPYCADCSHGRPHVLGTCCNAGTWCVPRRLTVACKPWPQEGTSP